MAIDRHRRWLAALMDAVGGAKGDLPAEVRRDLAGGKSMTGVLGAFAIKVSQNPSSIASEHIEALKRAGYSEDAIFECIIAAALGAGMERLNAGLAALEMGDPGDASR